MDSSRIGPPVETISLSEGFGHLLKTKPVGRSPRLLLHYLPSEEDFKFGILVPKRFAKRAVCRNALKRIFREACREKAKTHSRGRLLVRLTRPVPLVHAQDKAHWWKEIRQLLSALSPD